MGNGTTQIRMSEFPAVAEHKIMFLEFSPSRLNTADILKHQLFYSNYLVQIADEWLSLLVFARSRITVFTHARFR